MIKAKHKREILYDFINMNFGIGKTSQCLPKVGDEWGLSSNEYKRTFWSKENACIMIRVINFFICTFKMVIFIFDSSNDIQIPYSSPIVNLV